MSRSKRQLEKIQEKNQRIRSLEKEVARLRYQVNKKSRQIDAIKTAHAKMSDLLVYRPEEIALFTTNKEEAIKWLTARNAGCIDRLKMNEFSNGLVTYVIAMSIIPGGICSVKGREFSGLILDSRIPEEDKRIIREAIMPVVICQGGSDREVDLLKCDPIEFEEEV